jgi:hypothetical protein
LQLPALLLAQRGNKGRLAFLHQRVRTFEDPTAFWRQLHRIGAPILTALHAAGEALYFKGVYQSDGRRVE